MEVSENANDNGLMDTVERPFPAAASAEEPLYKPMTCEPITAQTKQGSGFTQAVLETKPAVGAAPRRILTSVTEKGKDLRAAHLCSINIFMVLVFCTILTVTFICQAVAFINIAKLKSDLETRHHTTSQLNCSECVEKLVSELENNQTQVMNVQLDTLSSGIAFLQNVTDAIVEKSKIYGNYSIIPACAALPPNSPSGYYWVRNSYGSAVRVYCDMTRSCGGVTGGWMRVAELNMTDSSQRCPSGLRQRTDGNIHTCVRNSDSAGCSSVILPTSNIEYSSVCGKVIAYQIGATNAFEGDNISSAYVDGVSLTHGNPRQHIWTFAAALDKSGNGNASSYCPCIKNIAAIQSIIPPSFVGDDYFCDTGSQQHMDGQPPQFYSADPLWDGCGSGNAYACCRFNTPPWFYKQLPDTTTDDIEMRVCRDEGNDNEDIAIEVVEIYVQ